MKEAVSWEAGVLVEKAYQDDKGKMHVVACASDDAMDLQSDQMSKSALDKMAEDANKGVPLLDNHKSTFEFGRSIKGAVVVKESEGKPVRQFVVDLELDGDWPQARALFKEIKGQKCEKQLSIGGKLNLKNPNAISIEMTEKGLIRRINDLELDHIACTRAKHAANPRTGFLAAVMKSLDDEPEMQKAWEDVKHRFEEDKSKQAAEKKDDKEEKAPPEKIDAEAEKDAEQGLSLLQKIGRMLRTGNGGNNMGGVKKEVRLSKGEKEETTTSDGSSISTDTAKKVDEMLATASPGLGAEENKADWPMDSESGSDSDQSGSDSSGSDDSGSDDSSQESSTPETTTQETTTGSTSSTGSTSTDEPSSTDESEPIGDDLGGDLGGDAGAPATPEEEEAARVLMARRRRLDELRKSEEQNDNEEEIVREIALLLSKAKRIGAGTRVEKEAMKGALWNVRFLLAKNIMEKIQKEKAGGKAEPGAAEAVASLIVDGGPYSPTTESAAKGEKVAGDKQTGETDMAASAVTAADKLPTYAEGQAKSAENKAPTAAESASMMTAAVGAVGKLPQMNDTAQYGKDKGQEAGNIEKALESVLSKSLEATSQMVLKTAEKIVSTQQAQFAEISKRLEKLETAGGVSQSAPRGTTDGEIHKTKAPAKGAQVWGGILGNAPQSAMRRM